MHLFDGGGGMQLCLFVGVAAGPEMDDIDWVGKHVDDGQLRPISRYERTIETVSPVVFSGCVPACSCIVRSVVHL